MFEFYFPHLMESASNGSWWPSLLGAVISGGTAILVFWLGKRSDRKTREKYLKEELRHLVKQLRKVLEYKEDSYDKNEQMATNYQEEPFGNHSHKLEVNDSIKRMLAMNSREIREALELFPKLKENQDKLHNRIYNAINYYQAHADTNEKYIYEMKKEWNQYQLQIDEEIAILPIDLKIFLQKPDIKEKYISFTEVYNGVVNRYFEAFSQDPSLKCGYEKFVLKFLQWMDDDYFKVPGFEAIVRRVKYLQSIYVRLRNKGFEISETIRNLDQGLKMQNDETLLLLKEIEPAVIKKTN